MCGIGGILRIVKPGDPDYPAADDSRRDASGAWLWHGLDVRDLAYSRVDAFPQNPGLRTQGPSWLIPESWLDAIDENITWRGPDGAGRFRDRVVRPDGSIVEVALVHRRLSIIDIASGGQPMVVTKCPRCAALASSLAPGGGGAESSRRRGSEAAGRTPQAASPPLSAIVFNGCIYNHRELRAELEAKGHVFESDHSDTEVILHLHHESMRSNNGFWNKAAHPSLEGMYAFALWDAAQGEVWFSRDRFGEKPLFVERHGTAKAFRFSNALGDQATRVSLGDDLQWCKEPWTPLACYKDAATDWVSLGHSPQPLPIEVGNELPPGSLLNTDDFGLVEQIKLNTFRGALLALGVTALGGVLLAVSSVVILASIVAAGAFVWFLIWTGAFGIIVKLCVPWLIAHSSKSLSTGNRGFRINNERLPDVISEAVLSRLDADVPLACFLSGGVDSSLIAHYAKQHLGRLTTLTVRMPDERYDESHYAELVGAHLGTSHITLDCNAESGADDFVHIIETLGLPFGDSSILPTYWLCRAAREHVKVALAGDGGDELFFGYDRYKAMKYLGWRLHFVRLLTTDRLDRADPISESDRKARLITAAQNAGYLDLLAIFPTPDREALLGRYVGSECRKTVFGGASRARQYDLDHYLPGDLLRKVDTASMLCNIEVRCPFLAKSVAEVALATPARVHMKGGETKHLLKELARKHLPREIVDRPKQGFAIPISDWWRNDFGGLQTLLLDMLAGDKPFGRVHDVLEINMGFVRQMLDEHWAAGGLTPMHTTRHVRRRDHGQRLFALVSLAIWARSIHRGDAESAEKRI